MRIVSLCWLLAALCCAQPVLAAENGATLSVLSFNVLREEWSKPNYPRWKERVEGAAKIIGRHNPDFVGLQEETPEMVSDLLARINGYAYLYPCQINGAGILFRYADWTPVETERTLTLDGRRVYFYNLHLSPFEDWRRLRGAVALRHRIGTRRHAALPVVVSGDFNSPVSSSAVRLLVEPGDEKVSLADSFAALHPNKDHPATVHAYGQLQKNLPVSIDHIFYNGSLVPVKHEVIKEQESGIFPSDHFPVLAIFRFQENIVPQKN